MRQKGSNIVWHVFLGSVDGGQFPPVFCWPPLFPPRTFDIASVALCGLFCTLEDKVNVTKNDTVWHENRFRCVLTFFDTQSCHIVWVPTTLLHSLSLFGILCWHVLICFLVHFLAWCQANLTHYLVWYYLTCFDMCLTFNARSIWDHPWAIN